MKRIVCIICLLAVFLSACSVQEQAPTFPEGRYTYGVYQLTFKEKLLSNSFVGNDWSFLYTHDGKLIESGYQITESLQLFSFANIDVEIRENDLIDDVGVGRLSVAICELGSGKTKITVTETNGLFKGRTAVWEISCEVTLVEKH